MVYDAIVVGGSYAGLAAATQLARARRRVLVVDSGQRRNRFAGRSHGFLTQDGTEAAAIAALGREQLLAYRTVEWLSARAVNAEKIDGGFRVHVEGADPNDATRLVLATGVVDTLPAVPGIAERWGRSVFHCPYCHGYELNEGRIGMIATSPLSIHMALMLPDWGATTLFLNGAFEPDAEELAKLAARGVCLDRGHVDRIDGNADVVMTDGRCEALDGLFVTTTVTLSSPIAANLGCEIEQTPIGPVITTDAMQATTVPGVYACGDTARAGGAVGLAVGDGTMAGAAAHQSMIFASP